MKTTHKNVLNRPFSQKVSILNFLKIGVVLALTFEMAGAFAESVPPARISDSVSMQNEAVSAISIATCPAGQVLSGGVCVALSSGTTVLSCGFGQVLSNGACINLPTAPTACASGTVLSGGVCVPLATVTPSCPAAIASTQTLVCPAGQTGQIDQVRTTTCDISTGYIWKAGAWSTTSNTCATIASSLCPTPVPEATRTPDCPAGQTGTYTQTRTNTCDATTGFTWSSTAWVTTSSSCTRTCPPGTKPDETFPGATCPSGQTGSQDLGRSVTCNGTTGAWETGNWAVTSSSCVSPSYTCSAASMPASTDTGTCPTGQTGSTSLTRSVTCDTTTGNWTADATWTTASSACSYTCSDATKPAATRPGACPAGQTGNTVESHSVTCNGANGTWSEGTWAKASDGTCAAPPPPAAAAGCPATSSTYNQCGLTVDIGAASVGYAGSVTLWGGICGVMTYVCLSTGWEMSFTAGGG